MTKAEFMEKYRHVIMGAILDAAIAERRGSMLGLFACNMGKLTDKILADQWADLIGVLEAIKPKEEPRTIPMNGVNTRR